MGHEHDQPRPDVEAVVDADVEADVEAVQEQLPLDEPVPYRLTAMGRRAVGARVPELRVVDGHVDLDEADGTARVRARALRRAGAHTLDIAEELGVEPLHVEAWVADLPVPPQAARHRRARLLRVVEDASGGTEPPDDEAVRAAWVAAQASGRDEAVLRLAREPGLHSGLGIVSGLLEPDPHALVLAGEHAELLAAAWSWVRATMEVRGASVRVLVRHEPGVAGDRVAHDTATALGLEVSQVSTTRDASRVGRRPSLRLRVSDPALAGRVLGWQRALVEEVTHGAG